VLNGRDAFTGRKAYLQKTVHGTKREAETELARFVTEVGDGAHASTKGATVGELLEQWFNYNEDDWSPTVVHTYRRIIDRHLVPRFGRSRFADSQRSTSISSTRSCVNAVAPRARRSHPRP